MSVYELMLAHTFSCLVLWCDKMNDEIVQNLLTCATVLELPHGL